MQSRKSKRGKRNLAETLESRARQIARRQKKDSWDTSPVAMLEREIGLTLGHIENVRALHKTFGQGLLRAECTIDTHIMQLTPHEPFYPQYRIIERGGLVNKIRFDKLSNRKLAVDEERRRLAIAREEKLESLHDRLLALLEKRATLSWDEEPLNK